jgi:GxxExxY protein
MSRSGEREALARRAAACGYRLHRDVGPGLLESVYEVRLAEYLKECGLGVARQVRVPITHKGKVLDEDFRADIVVEGRLLLQLKSAERISAVHAKQVLTCL